MVEVGELEVTVKKYGKKVSREEFQELFGDMGWLTRNIVKGAIASTNGLASLETKLTESIESNSIVKRTTTPSAEAAKHVARETAYFARKFIEYVPICAFVGALKPKRQRRYQALKGPSAEFSSALSSTLGLPQNFLLYIKGPMELAELADMTAVTFLSYVPETFGVLAASYNVMRIPTAIFWLKPTMGMGLFSLMYNADAEHTGIKKYVSNAVTQFRAKVNGNNSD